MSAAQRSAAALRGRAADLVRELGLAPHPEGGWFREIFRSSAEVQTADGRGPRSALTCIDFLLVQGEFSAWHRVASDEAWHLLEGQALRLWLLPPEAVALPALPGTASQTPAGLQQVLLGEGATRRHIVPAGWWQAAEPLGELAWAGATVGPGFDFADFCFGRDDAALCAWLAREQPALQRLL